MLAVMKTGAASVALDSSQPEERLRLIIKQVSPSVVLASSRNVGLAERLTDHLVYPVDQVGLSQIGTVDTTMLPKVRASSALYIQFTSGKFLSSEKPLVI